MAGQEVSFGDLLRRFRLAAGLTQEELAERGAVSVRAISDLERGLKTRPYRHTVRQLSEALGLQQEGWAALEASISRRRGPALHSVLRWPQALEQAHSLPRQLSSFVGREREIAQVREQLGASRLLTLTGPGGIGKTRLALAVAATTLRDYADGVWWVELGSLSDPLLVPATIARVFGVQPEVGRPLLETLAETLRATSLVLILDSCEHLVQACAELGTRLLSVCDQVQVLATSRELLGVEGEHVWPVPPLATVEVDSVLSAERAHSVEAVQLFVERARAAWPHFHLTNDNATAVVEICRRLDGLPLAIELAAAQVAALRPQQLLDRLIDAQFRHLPGATRTAPPRHVSLQATLDWSYRLLTEAEQVLYRRLAVFAGGWTIESAEAVVADEGADEILSDLVRLVAKSLVVAESNETGSTRYRFLETVRQDAWERLAASTELERMQERHTAHFLAFAERAQHDWMGPGEAAALDRFECEHGNFQASLAWLIERGDAQRGSRLARLLWLFWLHRGHQREGGRWLDRLLAMPSDRRTATWVELLYAAGSLAQDQGDVATAWERGQESLALARELADYSGASGALNLLANVATVRGEYAAARAMHEEGIRAGRAALEEPRDGVQMPRGRSIVLLELTHVWGLAISAFHQGDDAEARARAEETRSRASKEGLTRPLAIALWILGMVDLRHGRLAAARTLLRQSLELCNAVGERGSARMVVLFALASVERDQGNLVQARELLLDSLAISAGVGGLPWIASCFEAFAGLAAACRQPERALRLAGAAEQLYAANPINAARVYRYGLDQWLGRARRALGTAGAEKALVEGRALNRAAAVAEAIAVQVPAVSGTSPPKPRWDLHGRMAGGWPEQRK